MGLKDNIIEDAVSEAIEQSDIAPGELNDNIQKVMDTMDESFEQFTEIKTYLKAINTSANDIDNSSKDLAEASMELAKASQNIGQAVNELNSTSEEMKSDIEDLTEVLQRIDSHIPEEE